MKLPRMQTDLTKVTAALFAAVLMLLAAPLTMIQSTGQAASATTGSGQQGILVETTESISASITTPAQDLFGDTVLLNQIITWHPNGTTTLTDDLGRSFSFGVDTSDGSFKLLHDGPVVVQRITGNGLSYDIKWTPVVNEDGLVEKYKFTIVGQSEKGHKIKLPVKTDMKGLSERGNRLLASGDPNIVNATGGDAGGLGIDWSDAIAAGYKMRFDRNARAITVDVGKSFDVDPTTVDTLSTTLSPATTDYFEGEKRMVNVAGTVYVFYYDGANIAYKYSTNGGHTWSSKLSSTSGALNGDSHRWTVVNTKVGSTDYVTLLYFKLNGANTDFYAKRGTTSGGSITWSGATLLFSKANNAGCSSSVCAAATATTDTSGAVYAAFRYLASGQSSYQYSILKSTDGGLTWTTSLAEASSGSSTRISMAMTNLASGRILFAYGKYSTSELTYRTFSGTTWSAEATTSGAGMTANTVKQLSADSDSSNVGYIAYLVNAPPSTVKLAKWTSTGSFSAFETPPSGSLTHSLPSISIASDNHVHIYTIASSMIYETRKVAGTWQNPITNFGTTFTSPNQLTAGFSRAAAVWIEGSASPWTIRYDQLTLSMDPGFGCGYRNWGVSDWQNSSPPSPVFGKGTDCTTVLSTLVGRSNYVQLQAKNAAEVTESYETAHQGCSPWYTCDISPTPTNNRPALFSNTNFPVSTDQTCISSCNLRADLEYRLHNQFLWMADSVSKPVSPNAHGYVLTNIWFVDVAAGKVNGNWKNILVIDLPNTIVRNNAGTWVYESHAVGSQDSAPWYNTTPDGRTDFHISIVMGSGTTSGTWHDTGNVPLYQYIKTAFDSSYSGPNGTLIPKNLHPQSDWRLFNIEEGVSVQPGDGTAGNTFKVAYSMGRLSYN